MGNYDKYDNLSHYRLDKMENVTVIEEPARSFEEVSDYQTCFDVGDYASKIFQMYSGTDEMIDLVCSNCILEKMIDRFGEHVQYVSIGNERFRLRARGYSSEGLIEWLMMFADQCYIAAPESLRKAVKERAGAILKMQSSGTPDSK